MYLSCIQTFLATLTSHSDATTLWLHTYPDHNLLVLCYFLHFLACGPSLNFLPSNFRPLWILSCSIQVRIPNRCRWDTVQMQNPVLPTQCLWSKMCYAAWQSFTKRGDQFQGSYDENWELHVRKLVDLCPPFDISRPDIVDFFCHLLKVDALTFYYTICSASGATWPPLQERLSSHYDHDSKREEIPAHYTTLRFSDFRAELKTDAATLEALMGQIEKPDSVLHDWYSDPFSRLGPCLLQSSMVVDRSHWKSSAVQLPSSMQGILRLSREQIAHDFSAWYSHWASFTAVVVTVGCLLVRMCVTRTVFVTTSAPGRSDSILNVWLHTALQTIFPNFTSTIRRLLMSSCKNAWSRTVSNFLRPCLKQQLRPRFRAFLLFVCPTATYLLLWTSSSVFLYFYLLHIPRWISSSTLTHNLHDIFFAELVDHQDNFSDNWIVFILVRPAILLFLPFSPPLSRASFILVSLLLDSP